MNRVSEALHISSARDPEIYLLSRALDRDYMKHALQEVIGNTRDGARVTGVRSAELVRRKPSRRCLIKYNVVLRRNSETRTLWLLGKLRARGIDWRTFRLTTELWNSDFGPNSDDGVYVPEPVGALPKLNMWLQRRIDAKPLATALGRRNGLQYCADTGYALGKLHSLGPITDRHHKLTDELDTLSRRLRSTCNETPEYESRIRRVLAACHELAETIPESEPVGIHRDFYPDQVLSKPRSTWLIDLDLFALGDRALDLGNFVAHLQELSLRQYGNRQRYSAHERAFLDAYTNSTGYDDCRFAADAYATLSLVRLVAISRIFPARRNSIGKLLSLCEERLGIYDKNSSTKPERKAVFLQGDLS